MRMLIGMMAFIACTSIAQKPYVEVGEDLDSSQARLTLNRAP